MQKYTITEHLREGKLPIINTLEIETSSMEAAKSLATKNRQRFNTMLRVVEHATGQVRIKLQNAWQFAN